jgi:hypothetical protein
LQQGVGFFKRKRPACTLIVQPAAHLVYRILLATNPTAPGKADVKSGLQSRGKAAGDHINQRRPAALSPQARSLRSDTSSEGRH